MMGSVDPANGDRVWDFGTMPLETKVLPGPIEKSVIETQQFSDLMRVAQASGATQALQSYVPGNDPPDLIVTPIGGTPLAVELTTLSVTHLARQRLNEIRRLGRDLGAKVADKPDKFEHLVGRTVSLAEHESDARRPRKRTAAERAALVEALAYTLEDDFGIAFEWPSEYNDAEEIPAHVAQLGVRRIEEYALTVHRSQPEGSAPPSITADIQLRINETDLLARLKERIDAKDIAANQVLLISTGLVDSQGYVVRGDLFIYHKVKEICLASELAFKPKHLNQVILHHWGSNEAIVIYERPGAPILMDRATYGQTGAMIRTCG